MRQILFLSAALIIGLASAHAQGSTAPTKTITHSMVSGNTAGLTGVRVDTDAATGVEHYRNRPVNCIF
jgi:hypothetical protein